MDYRLRKGLSHEEWRGPLLEKRIIVCKQSLTLSRSEEDHGFISMNNIYSLVQGFLVEFKSKSMLGPKCRDRCTLKVREGTWLYQCHFDALMILLILINANVPLVGKMEMRVVTCSCMFLFTRLLLRIQKQNKIGVSWLVSYYTV